MRSYAGFSEHQFAAFRLDHVNQCLWRGAEQIPLSPKAYCVLRYLVERSGRLATKSELLDAVWPNVHVTEGVLKRAILEIRKALADPIEQPVFIQTMHRRGYRFLCPVSETSGPESIQHDQTLAGCRVVRTGRFLAFIVSLPQEIGSAASKIVTVPTRQWRAVRTGMQPRGSNLYPTAVRRGLRRSSG